MLYTVHTVTSESIQTPWRVFIVQNRLNYVLYLTQYSKRTKWTCDILCMYEKIWNLLFALVFTPRVAVHAVWQWWQQEVFLGVICTPGIFFPRSSLQIPSNFVSLIVNSLSTVFLWGHFSWNTQGHYLSQSQTRIISALCCRSFWHWMKNLFSWQRLCAGFLQRSLYIWLYSTSVMSPANPKACCWE